MGDFTVLKGSMTHASPSYFKVHCHTKYANYDLLSEGAECKVNKNSINHGKLDMCMKG